MHFNVREFNEQFQSKFPSMQALSQSRMKEILRRFVRFNLIEVDWEDEFTDSTIQILPTLRFAIPFPGIEQWVKAASAFNAESDDAAQEEEVNILDDDTESDETPISSAEEETKNEESIDEETPIISDEADEDEDDDEEVGLLDDEEEEQ